MKPARSTNPSGHGQESVPMTISCSYMHALDPTCSPSILSVASRPIDPNFGMADLDFNLSAAAKLGNRTRGGICRMKPVTSPGKLRGSSDDRTFRHTCNRAGQCAPMHVHFGAGRLGLGLLIPSIAESDVPFCVVQRPSPAFSQVVGETGRSMHSVTHGTSSYIVSIVPTRNRC